MTNSIRDILDKLWKDAWGKLGAYNFDGTGEDTLTKDQAETALNAYILGEVMAIIGDDLTTDMFGSWTPREDGTMILLSDEVIITNNLKTELRNKANKKWGK